MTQQLETLKNVLQKTLNRIDNEHFLEAVEDGIYSCQYETTTPLIQWINSWEVLDQDSSVFDEQYQQGVQFVTEQWETIKGDEQ